MPRGQVGYLIFWLCCEKLKQLIITYDCTRHDQFMMEMRMVLGQVLSAAQFHNLNEDHCDVVFMQLANIFLQHWLIAMGMCQRAGDVPKTVPKSRGCAKDPQKDCAKESGIAVAEGLQSQKDCYQASKKRKRPAINDVPHAEDLSIQHLEAWKAVVVKQGETPREGPTTEKLVEYLAYFKLSTNKSNTRLERLNLLFNFLRGESTNQDGKSYSKFRCKKRGEQ